MSDRTELLRKHAKLQREIREVEIRAAKATLVEERLQGLKELDKLRVQLGEVEW
jgi:hypothetical protein